MRLLKVMLAAALVLDAALIMTTSAATSGKVSQTIGYSLENTASVDLPIHR